MLEAPSIISLDELRRRPASSAWIWAVPEVLATVRRGLPFPVWPVFESQPGADTLVVVGGGTLIDEAKGWRFEQAPGVQLVAIPSIWGSGAEASPVLVRNREGRKVIQVDPRFKPDFRVLWPELAVSISRERARIACGDVWAHAIEGFLSPLATAELRADLAALMMRMLALPLANAPEWFDLSAYACAGQARASVGLVHGMAHVLEGPLKGAFPRSDWGHARLCSILLWPVLRFNEQFSASWPALGRCGLSPEQILGIARSLYDEDAYGQVLSLLESQWMNILRDPSTRTNSALVRPGSLSFFTQRAFQ